MVEGVKTMNHCMGQLIFRDNMVVYRSQSG
ncbi:hypothetical protein E2C01_017483 [Portunus trituberculatus]|uniref:Uncharacterized protein n=1 Tax=Portunus trituberculatus TaxID=210409 RepID=A0A5B7DRU8_PORTR|nr:hypothetical protein [Portunus trituberculatus]